MIYRGDYWQCGFVIPKGGSTRSAGRGLEAFRDEIAEIAPVPEATGSASSSDWDERQAPDRHRRPPAPLAPPRPALHRRRGPRDVADRRRRHQPRDPGRRRHGQPPGPPPARTGDVTIDDLAQGRSADGALPTRVTQRLQVLVQNRVIGRVLGTPQRSSHSPGP